MSPIIRESPYFLEPENAVYALEIIDEVWRPSFGTLRERAGIDLSL